ncbi:hypothetical protein M427DRAFT_30303 [Gonapodya prolifera JEL478]|uniref:Uncharacterized protein n=1 Tax=Gonapodya prolifera (strain JEL478) TaxID=1344416 RepID=A0A139AKZ8_GONPJ|nr:hypothetical protein M427DRAFT_30303 [Gonapodya prolifera JEL478]|eukprot:KXS17472.1 hypothetical protein M427DRAFT_30303 [Gonapodya prolifera JEL478]
MSELRKRPVGGESKAPAEPKQESQPVAEQPASSIPWDAVISIVFVLLGVRLVYVGLGFAQNEFDVWGWLDRVLLGIERKNV